MHARDRSRSGHNAGPEPFRQQGGGEPVIAVAVRNEDVRDPTTLSSDPVAERTRLIRRERGIREHRILAPEDQRTRDRRASLRLSIRKETSVPRRRAADEHLVMELRWSGHGAAHQPERVAGIRVRTRVKTATHTKPTAGQMNRE